MTSEPRRDPVTDPFLTPQNSALVVIDYQPSQIQVVTSIDHDLLRRNIVSVARLSKAYGLPIVLSTVNVANGQPPTIPELKEVLSDSVEIDRTQINSWEDTDFRRAVEATGRKKLIMTALWTEVCLAFPALDALRLAGRPRRRTGRVWSASCRRAHNPSAGYPSPANCNATGRARTRFPTWWTSCSPLASWPGSETSLTPHSRCGRRVLEVDSHLGQRARDSVNGRRIDRIEEAMPNAREVNAPCGLQLDHPPRSESRDVAPRVGGACRLRHEAPRLEIVHQAGHPARRQVGGVGQVGHPQLAIGSFGEVHDRRVLARRQAGASDQVVVQMSREDFHDSHQCAPDHFFGRGKWFDGSDASQDTC
jgi:Isochorismatase family